MILKKINFINVLSSDFTMRAHFFFRLEILVSELGIYLKSVGGLCIG